MKHPLVLELYFFTIKNAWASIYGGLLLFGIIATEYIDVIPGLARYDEIFIYAVLIQCALLLSGLETLREFFVVVIFHVLATIMELFKTHPDIGSWAYPYGGETVFIIATVPLFTGFLYSAVGSYITRATKVLCLQYIDYPAQWLTIVLAVLIYGNFFAHHYTYDIRFLLFGVIAVLFYRTTVSFQVYQRVWRLPFIITGILTAFFIWIAENIGSYSNVWLYPDQVEYWQMVSLGKMGSWFLLLVMSFVIVKTLHIGNNTNHE